MSTATPEQSFETLKSNVLDSIKTYFPFQGRRQSLVLDKIWVEDALKSDDLRSQANAKDLERTWGVPIKAELKLVDNVTGKVVDKHQTTLARLPKLTSRYGYIVDGNEMQVDHLFRLRSGVYARIQENGELESEFNLAKSPIGRGFSVHINPKTKQISWKLGESKTPIYPILKALGVADDQMVHDWGKEIFEANKPKNEEKTLKSLKSFYEKTSDDGAPDLNDPAALSKHVYEFFDQTALNPHTTKTTLGKSFDKVSGETLRLAANKILGVSRGTHKPDDRDSLAFKEIVSAEDFIPEKIQRNARSIRARLRQTVDRSDAVKDIISTDIFARPIHEFFTKGGSVAERSDQTNPVLMMSGHRKTTLFSDQFGGIKDEHRLTDDMRVINPSHFGFLDPMHTPESERTGITLNLSLAARKKGRDLETPAYDIKTGKLSYINAPTFHYETTAVLPDQVRWVNGKPTPIADKVKVKMPGGEIELRPFKDATHVMPTAKGMFDVASNLIPFLPSNQGNRVSMADKQMEQAISLKNREIPLVQSKTDSADPSHTFEKMVGSFTSHKAPVAGKVVAVKDDSIIISDGKKKHEVQLYDHFPLNDPKGMMHSESAVKVGDSVKAGQHIADTNFTKGGHLALGANLRVGYLPYKGYNYEDGIVISESAAKKLTSEHLYKKKLEIDPDKDQISKKAFRAFASRKFAEMKRDHWDALDDDGIIKPGTKVMPGQVLIAAIGDNSHVKQRGIISEGYGNRAFQRYKDKSLTWDEDHVGTVVKVVKDPSGRGHKVYIKTEEQMQVGDKISGRHGNKGIVTMVLPDHEMPFTKDEKGEKRHLEVMLNPTGVPTRINVGQVLETAAAKIGEKIGKPFIVDNFAGPHVDYRQHVENELKKHGISDEEQVYDPKDPTKALGSVLVGPQYLLKLKHQVEKKLSVRGGGTDLSGRPLPYSVDRQPTKGGERGGQGFGALEVYSLLGHGARHNLREMATYKSDQQSPDFWQLIQMGHEPPPPKPPFAYEKFVSLLKGAGVNVLKEGTAIRLQPLTDHEIVQLAGGPKGEIKKGNLTVRSKDLREEPHGLFDPHITGGLDGSKWGFIRLAEPMPNPIFVGENVRPGPIPVLLGLKMKDIDEVMAGHQQIDGKTGGRAIEEALKKIDVKKEIKETREKIGTMKGNALDRANKKLKFLSALEQAGMQPHEAYVLRNVPVIPPKFRPATPTDRGDVNVAPLNGLYRNLSILNQKLTEVDPKIFSEEHKNPVRASLWDSFKALQSVGSFKNVYDMDANSQRKLKGILDTIGSAEGEQPKEGFFQSTLVKRRQNLSIRSTIIPEPNLHIDQVGLPKNAAMELYKPFVVAQMVKWGHTPLDSQKLMREGNKVAFDALERVVKDRPIILKRDPALHKFSEMAFEPVLIEGKAIQIHPLVTGGFNADFDGDTMAGTVPISKDAVEEAKRMFPSKNLFSPTTGGVMYTPSQEAMLGLHLLSKWGDKKHAKPFKSVAELSQAVEKGVVHPNDVVKVSQLGGKETTFGRILIDSKLPRAAAVRQDILHNSGFEVTKKTLGSMATSLAKDHTRDFAESINKLKDLGNEHAYKFGFSFGLKDLKPLPERDAIIERAHKEVEKIKSTAKNPDDLDKKTIEIYQKATEEIDKALRGVRGNRLGTMVMSGARGKIEQYRQMVAAPMLMQDATNRTISVPVTKSYAEGLDLGSYWLAQHGARKGTLQRAQGTSEPGALSKDIINTTMSTVVVSNDCKTSRGISIPVDHPDIHDRFTAVGYKLKDGKSLPSGTLLTPEILNRLRNNLGPDKTVLVRSPLKCQHGEGICAKCFGLNENGKLHDAGTNIGVLAGQSLGEPAVQLAMDAFHAGGVAAGRGAQSVDRFTRLNQLLKLPKRIRNEGTLARSAGKISDIKKDAAGGVDIFIGGERHYVPKHLVKEDLKVGHEVKRGEMLSHGLVNPNHLLKVTDMPTVQNHLTNEMYRNFEKEGVRRRNVEVVIRGLTNLTKVKDPGHSDYAPGDHVPHSVVEEHNRSLPKGKKPILHEPILKSITQVPLTASTDWLARLNYKELHSTLQQAAQQGWKSDLHGTHPIPGFAYGAEFGKPPATKKPYMY